MRWSEQLAQDAAKMDELATQRENMAKYYESQGMTGDAHYERYSASVARDIAARTRHESLLYALKGN